MRSRSRAFLSARSRAVHPVDRALGTGVSWSAPVVPSLSLRSLVAARREFSSAGLCASSDGDCAPKPKQRTTLPSEAPLAVAPSIHQTRRRLVFSSSDRRNEWNLRGSPYRMSRNDINSIINNTEYLLDEKRETKELSVAIRLIAKTFRWSISYAEHCRSEIENVIDQKRLELYD